MTTRRWLLASAIAVAALLLIGRVAVEIHASYAWYDALGATSVWRARVTTMTMLRIAAWIAASLFVLGHLFTVRQSVVSLIVQRQVGDLEIPESLHGRYLTGATAALAVVTGGLLSLAQPDWTTAFLAGNGGSFNEYDNYFGSDLGFYVFWLPFESGLWSWSVLVVMVTTALVVALYVLTSGLAVEDGSLRISSHARRHLTVMVGILLLMLSWNFRLQMYQLLLNGTGPGGAFGYFDHRVAQHGSLVLSLGALAAGLVVMVAGVSSQRIALLSTACVFVLWIAARQVAPVVVASATSDADPAARERQYIATQAGYTRRAYGLERIRVGDSTAVFSSEAAALASMPLWDEPMLRLALTSGAASDSTGSWVSWRTSSRGPIADFVRRDAGAESGAWTVTTVDAGAASFAGDIVTIADSSGRPGGERALPAPLIFPGATGYRVVADSAQRVVGTAIGSRASLMAHAWSLQSPRLLRDDVPEPDPILVDVRDVRDRVRQLVPFFEQGSEVTPIVLGDTVYWVVDLYAASNWYPLSVPIRALDREWRYFQHAAVAVVDGSSGDVMLMADELLDPLARIWVTRFQSLFTTPAALPAGVREALPPAVDQLRAHAVAFGRFGTQAEAVESMRLPDAPDSAGVATTLVNVTADGRGTMMLLALLDSTGKVRGVIVGAGGERRGTAWISTLTGPDWASQRDRLDGVDSAGGRRLRRYRSGIRALPVGEGLLFAQPVFTLTADSVPSFAFMAVATGDSARRTGPSPRGAVASPGDIRTQVQAIYAALRAALQRNDWIAFGQAMDALSRVAVPGSAGK